MERYSPILGIRSDNPAEAAKLKPMEEYKIIIRELQDLQKQEASRNKSISVRWNRNRLMELAHHNEEVRDNLYKFTGII